MRRALLLLLAAAARASEEEACLCQRYWTWSELCVGNWAGEEDICKLFPRVMATEQLGAHPLAFQLIETRPLTSGQNNSHVIGTGKICLVKAAQHMSEINDEEIVVDTFVVKHGIRRGNLVCAFKANLEYY